MGRETENEKPQNSGATPAASNASALPNTQTQPIANQAVIDEIVALDPIQCYKILGLPTAPTTMLAATQARAARLEQVGTSNQVAINKIKTASGKLSALIRQDGEKQDPSADHQDRMANQATHIKMIQEFEARHQRNNNNLTSNTAAPVGNLQEKAAKFKQVAKDILADALPNITTVSKENAYKILGLDKKQEESKNQVEQQENIKSAYTALADLLHIDKNQLLVETKLISNDDIQTANEALACVNAAYAELNPSTIKVELIKKVATLKQQNQVEIEKFKNDALVKIFFAKGEPIILSTGQETRDPEEFALDVMNNVMKQRVSSNSDSFKPLIITLELCMLSAKKGIGFKPYPHLFNSSIAEPTKTADWIQAFNFLNRLGTEKGVLYQKYSLLSKKLDEKSLDLDCASRELCYLHAMTLEDKLGIFQDIYKVWLKPLEDRIALEENNNKERYNKLLEVKQQTIALIRQRMLEVSENPDCDLTLPENREQAVDFKVKLLDDIFALFKDCMDEKVLKKHTSKVKTNNTMASANNTNNNNVSNNTTASATNDDSSTGGDTSSTGSANDNNSTATSSTSSSNSNNTTSSTFDAAKLKEHSNNFGKWAKLFTVGLVNLISLNSLSYKVSAVNHVRSRLTTTQGFVQDNLEKLADLRDQNNELHYVEVKAGASVDPDDDPTFKSIHDEIKKVWIKPLEDKIEELNKEIAALEQEPTAGNMDIKSDRDNKLGKLAFRAIRKVYIYPIGNATEVTEQQITDAFDRVQSSGGNAVSKTAEDYIHPDTKQKIKVISFTENDLTPDQISKETRPRLVRGHTIDAKINSAKETKENLEQVVKKTKEAIKSAKGTWDQDTLNGTNLAKCAQAEAKLINNVIAIKDKSIEEFGPRSRTGLILKGLGYALVALGAAILETVAVVASVAPVIVAGIVDAVCSTEMAKDYVGGVKRLHNAAWKRINITQTDSEKRLKDGANDLTAIKDTLLKPGG